MRRAWLLLALLLTGAVAFAEPPVDVAPKVAAKKPAAKPAAKAKAPARPEWAELTAEQQKTLAPLKADWESLETERRRKWIGRNCCTCDRRRSSNALRWAMKRWPRICIGFARCSTSAPNDCPRRRINQPTHCSTRCSI